MSATTLSATTLTGTLSSGAQTGISAVGTLTGLSVSGNNDGVSITNTTATGNTNIKLTNDNRSWEIGLKGSTAAAGAVNGLYIYDNANTAYRLVVNSSGNIGINTSAPSYRLEVSGTFNATTYYSGGTLMNTIALTSVTAGTAAANKAIILDGSANITSINALTATYLYGAISTASQTGITAVGTLTSLSSSGAVTFTSSLDATSSTAGGALTVTGGAAIGSTLYVGTGIYGSIKTASQSLITSLGTLTGLTVSGTIAFNNTTDSTGNSDGALVLAGGMSIAKKLYVTNGIYGTIGTASQTGITVVGTLTSLSSSGAVTFTAGTASTNTTSGTLVVTGGVGISGATYIGGTLNVTGNITGTIVTATQGSITSLGTLTSLTISGATSLTANTTSTNTTTGALVVTGGVGIGGALNTGGNINSSGTITGTNLYGTVSTATQGSITSLGTLTSLTISGATSLTANTSSTNTTTGALVVTGGVGIGGALNVGGNISGTIATATQGSITSLGTLTSLTVSGATSLTANTSSTNTTTGALIITGGVGIGGALNVGGNLNVTGNISGNFSNLNLAAVNTFGLNSTLSSTLITTWNNISTGIASKVWNAITWVPELNSFIAVANDTSSATNSVMVSTDGITWTGKNASAAKNWKSICWSPDLLLAVAVGVDASTSNIMISSDGAAWISRTSPVSGVTYNSIIWVRELGLFVAVGYKAATTTLIMTSPDGITWTSRTVPTTLSWNSLTWSKELGMIIAVATDASASNIIYSYDGIGWTTATNPSSAVGWSDVKWSKELGLFVIMPNTSASATYLTSVNGTSWTSRTLSNTPTNYISSIIWVPEVALFVAAQYNSSTFYYSTSGTSWTTFTVSTSSQWNSLAWSPELATIAVVNTLSSATYSVITSVHTSSSYLNIVNNNQYSNTSKLGISADSQLVFKGGLNGGYRWTNTTSTSTSNELMRLTKDAYLGINKPSPRYNLDVGGTIRGTNVISTGALVQTLLQNWNILSSGQSSTFNYKCIAYSPELSRIVILADSTSTSTSAIIYSSDGINWTAANAPANKNWYSVIWVPELFKFIACSFTSGSSTNQFSYSSDGITWTAVNAPSTNALSSICWAPEIKTLVAVSNNSSTTNSISYSYDGITWTGTNGPTAINYNSVSWSNSLKLFVAVSDASSSVTNAYAYSSDGITWSGTNAPSTQIWTSVCWSRELSMFVTVANNTSSSTNTAAYSSNGTTWTAVNSVAAKNWGTVLWVAELGIFVALAKESTAVNNSVMYSINGTSWVAGNNVVLSNIAWTNMIWMPELSQILAVGPSNTMMSSYHKTTSQYGLLTNNQYSNTSSTYIGGNTALQYQSGLNGKHIWYNYQSGNTTDELMRLTSNGLGINKSNPVYSLDIEGTARTKKLLIGSAGFSTEAADTSLLASFADTTMATTSSKFITLGQSTSANNRAEFEYYYAGSGSTSNLLRIGFNGQANSSRLVFSPDGYLGIGITTTTPVCKLHLGGTSSDRLLSLYYVGSDFYGFGANNSALELLSKTAYRFYLGSTGSSLGTEIIRITSTGMGIKNTSPAYELDVTGTGNFTTLIASGNITGANLYGTVSTAAQGSITSLGTLTALTVSGATALTSSTTSSSSSTGALVVTGGVGIGGALNVGGGIYGAISTASQTGITAIGTLSSLAVNGSSSSVVITNGAASGSSNIRFTNDNRSWELGIRGSTAASGIQNGFYIYDNNTPGYRLQIDTSGNVLIYASTASTSNTTGALIVTGGISSSNKINATSFQTNGAISSAAWLTAGIGFNQTAATYTNTSTAGTYATAVAHSLQQPTFASTNVVTITDAANFYIDNAPTTSSSTTITRSWAAWINSGKLLIGSPVSAASSLVINNSTTYSDNEGGIHGITICAGTAITNQVLYMGTDQTNASSYLQSTKASAVGNISLNPRGGTVSIGAINSTYGLYVSGTTNLNSSVYVGGTQVFDSSRNISNIGTISASGVISFTNSTASTTTTNGALVVTGGVGIGGAITTGGTITTPAISVSSATNHAISVTNTSSTGIADIKFINDNRSWEFGLRGGAVGSGLVNGLYLYDNAASSYRLQIDTTGNVILSNKLTTPDININGTKSTDLITNWSNNTTIGKSIISVAWSSDLSMYAAVSNVAGANNVVYSTNGTSWSAGTSSATTMTWKSITYSPDLKLFVAVGVNSGTTTSNIGYSNNGTSWTLTTTPTASLTYQGVAWSPINQMFVAVATGSATGAYSYNGTTWIANTMPSSSAWNNVKWCNSISMFIAVSTTASTSNMAYSSDGINWTAITTPNASYGYYDVAWSDKLGYGVAVPNNASSAIFLNSTNGTTWSSATLSPTTTNGITSVVWVDELNMFVAGQYNNTSAYYSQNGTSWSTFTVPAGNSLLGIAWSPELSQLVMLPGNAAHTWFSSILTENSVFNLVTNNQYSNTTSVGITADTSLTINSGLGGSIRWRNGGLSGTYNELMRLSQSGNLGIGYKYPSKALDIYTTTSTNSGMRIRSTTPTILTDIYTDTNGNLVIFPDAQSIIIGNPNNAVNTADNVIKFGGLYGDAGSTMTIIAERLYSGNDKSELLLFKGNDYGAGSSGPDRIRLRAGEHRFQIMTSTETYGSIGDDGNKMIIGASGVGIGTISPGYTLHIDATNATSTVNTYMRIDNPSGPIFDYQCSNSAGFIGTSSNHNLRIITNGTTRIAIGASGNVTIGGTASLAPLGIVASNSSSSLWNTWFSIDNSGTSSGPTFVYQNTTGISWIGNTGAHDLRLGVGNNTRIHIDGSTGWIGINNTSPRTYFDMGTTTSSTALAIYSTATQFYGLGASSGYLRVLGPTGVTIHGGAAPGDTGTEYVTVNSSYGLAARAGFGIGSNMTSATIINGLIVGNVSVGTAGSGPVDVSVNFTSPNGSSPVSAQATFSKNGSSNNDNFFVTVQAWNSTSATFRIWRTDSSSGNTAGWGGTGYSVRYCIWF